MSRSPRLPFPTLASPARRALAGAGHVGLESLTQVTEADVAGLHGMGPRALGALRQALAAHGLAFAAAPTKPTRRRLTRDPSCKA